MPVGFQVLEVFLLVVLREFITLQNPFRLALRFHLFSEIFSMTTIGTTSHYPFNLPVIILFCVFLQLEAVFAITRIITAVTSHTFAFFLVKCEKDGGLKVLEFAKVLKNIYSVLIWYHSLKVDDVSEIFVRIFLKN